MGHWVQEALMGRLFEALTNWWLLVAEASLFKVLDLNEVTQFALKMAAARQISVQNGGRR